MGKNKIPFNKKMSIETSPYANLQFTDAVTGKWMLTDCADRDAFGRLRISNLVTLYEGSTIYDSNVLFFDNDLTANASITGPGSDACMTLSVNSTSVANQYAARQTHFYAHYQPGKSFLAMFSFSFGPAVVGIVKRVGFYDVDNDDFNNPLNGILFEQSDSGLAWKLYKGDGIIVQTAIQSAWNVDPLNGSGPSGLTLNSIDNLLGFVDLEWLGVGRVRVGFFLNGVPVVVHCFNNAGFSVPYTNNPLLPIRFEIRKTVANANSGSMNAICCTILSEGGFEQIGISRSMRSPWISINNALQKSLLALRLKKEYPRNSLSAVSLEIASDIGGNANAYYQLYLWRPSSSAVVIPGTWNDVSTTVVGGSGSYAEYNTNDSLLATINTDVSTNNAICVLIGESSITSIAKSSFEAVQRSLASLQSGVEKLNRDIYVVVVNNATSNARNFSALFNWREF